MGSGMPKWQNTKVLFLAHIAVWAVFRLKKYGTPVLSDALDDALAAWWSDYTIHYIDPYRPVDQRIGMRRGKP